MKTPKPKVATKKKLLESIEHLQMTLAQARKDEERERGARHTAQEALKQAESKLRDSEWQLSQTRQRERILETSLAQEDARAEALELALRLMHKAERQTEPVAKERSLMGDTYDMRQTSHFPR